jgi:ribose transport system ATP-binding protein
MKIVYGTLRPDHGALRLGGETYVPAGAPKAHSLGIAMVFQELSLVPKWSVAENLALVDRRLRARVRDRSLQEQAAATMGRWGVRGIDPRTPVEALSLAQRQRLEVVRAVERMPRLLILDEATSALAAPEVDWLMDLVKGLTERGTAVLYSSHRFDEIRRIADEGTVLRDGHVVGSFDRAGMDSNRLISLMAGRAVTEMFPEPPPAPTGVAPILEVQGLRCAGLRGVDLRLHPGEILGVGGLQGHGQTELLGALIGGLPAAADRWVVAGHEVRGLKPSTAKRLGVGFVPEERKTQGLALGLSSGENLIAPRLRVTGSGGRVATYFQRDWIGGVMRRLNIVPPNANKMVGELSGGNQQKVVVGRWLTPDLKILLLADPARGIDIPSKQLLYGLLCRLAEEGVAILLYTTDVDELVHLCHRVAVMYRGRVAQELERSELNAESVLGAALQATVTTAERGAA